MYKGEEMRGQSYREMEIILRQSIQRFYDMKEKCKSELMISECTFGAGECLVTM